MSEALGSIPRTIEKKWKERKREMEGREKERKERRREGDREAGMEGGRKDETFSKYMADRKTFITVIRKI